MDRDGDRTISLEEFQAAHERIFKAMDSDKDGAVRLAQDRGALSGLVTEPSPMSNSTDVRTIETLTRYSPPCPAHRAVTALPEFGRPLRACKAVTSNSNPGGFAGSSMFDVAAPLLTALIFGLLAYATDCKGHHILTAMLAGGALSELRADLGMAVTPAALVHRGT